MARGLSAGEIANLGLETYKSETLVELYLPLFNFYLTTGDSDVSVNTATTTGSQTFVPESFISDIDSIYETFEPRPIEIGLQFQRLVSGFQPYLNDTAIGSRVVIYKMFRNLSDNTADTTNLIQVFDGIINSLDVSENPQQKVYNIRCASDFGFFLGQRGRTTANIVGALTNRNIQWGEVKFE
jgi:hypothetical protein